MDVCVCVCVCVCVNSSFKKGMCGFFFGSYDDFSFVVSVGFVWLGLIPSFLFRAWWGGGLEAGCYRRCSGLLG